MSQTFNTQALAGDRVLVTGTDQQSASHQVILDAAEFNALRARDAQLEAADSFDDAVVAFFAPLTEAAAKAEEAAKPVLDPATFIVVQEHVSGTPHVHEELHFLQRDTVVLRLIAQGNTSRLLWVGDSIEVLEFVPPAPVDEIALEDIVSE